MSLVFSLHLFFPVFKKYIYLFGCTGVLVAAYGIFDLRCGLWDPVP